jgi:hypothetical protein
MHFYVTDWAPNGTNDLLAVDDNWNVVDCLPEATFGIDVTSLKDTESRALILEGTDCVSSIDEDRNEYADAMPALYIAEVTPFTLHRKLAVSPGISAAESRARLVEFLKRNLARKGA